MVEKDRRVMHAGYFQNVTQTDVEKHLVANCLAHRNCRPFLWGDKMVDGGNIIALENHFTDSYCNNPFPELGRCFFGDTIDFDLMSQ